MAGNVEFAPGPGRMAVDTTPPRIDVHSVPAGWVSRADIDMTATDNLQAARVGGSTRLRVQIPLDGVRTVEVDTRGFATGVYVARLESGGRAVASARFTVSR